MRKTILKIKNTFDPQGRIRTYRRLARKSYLNFQRTKKKSALKQWQIDRIKANLAVAKRILAQQVHMATTRVRQVANSIVSFHWPEIRPMVRGKEGQSVEFGPKAHVALVDGFSLLDHAQFDSFHEGIQLESCLAKHPERFDRKPDIVLADQLYANRANRQFLLHESISHSFKRMGRPPSETPEQKRKHAFMFKQKQGQRHHIEATFGHLKNRFNLDKVSWTISSGAHMQIQLGLIAFNWHTALAKA